MRSRHAVHIEEAREHEGAPQEEVEGELHRGVLFIGGTPDDDQEIHRDHRHLVVQEEEKEVGRHENAEDPRDQKQHVGEEIFHAVGDGPGNEDAAENDDRGQEEHGKAYAVDGIRVVDAVALYPGDIFNELEIGIGGVKLEAKINRQNDRGGGGSQRNEPNQILTPPGCEKDQKETYDRAE